MASLPTVSRSPHLAGPGTECAVNHCFSFTRHQDTGKGVICSRPDLQLKCVAGSSYSAGKHSHKTVRAAHLSGWEVETGHLVTIVTAILSVVLSPREPRRSVKRPAGTVNGCSTDSWQPRRLAVALEASTHVLSDDRPTLGGSVLNVFSHVQT